MSESMLETAVQEGYYRGYDHGRDAVVGELILWLEAIAGSLRRDRANLPPLSFVKYARLTASIETLAFLIEKLPSKRRRRDV